MAAGMRRMRQPLPPVDLDAVRDGVALQEEQEEAEKERKETEAALKMSMQADMAEAGKVDIPMISVDEFKTQTKDFVKEMFRVLLEGVRSGGIRFMQDDNILSFAKTILGGSLKDAMPELAKEEFQDSQREALSKTAGEFMKQSSESGSLGTPQQVNESAGKVSRMDFDLQFYTLLI